MRLRRTKVPAGSADLLRELLALLGKHKVRKVVVNRILGIPQCGKNFCHALMPVSNADSGELSECCRQAGRCCAHEFVVVDVTLIRIEDMGQSVEQLLVRKPSIVLAKKSQN